MMTDRTPDETGRTPEEMAMPQPDDELARHDPARAEDDTTSAKEAIDPADVPATETTEVIDPVDGSPAAQHTAVIDSPSAAPSFAAWSQERSSVNAPPQPRVRIAAIVWGLLVVAFAACAVAIAAVPEARRAVDAWQASLTPAGWAVVGVVALGVVVLLIAGTSAIRRAQR